MRPNHLLRCAARWLLAAGAACSMAGAHAGVTGISGSQAGTTRSFDLFAEEGYLSMADGVQVYSWGYGAPVTTTNGTGRMQVSGPTLLVNQGETVTVNFTNRLPARSSIVFPGQSGVSTSGGSAGALTAEVGPNESVSYTFTAAQPGTYLYQSGTQSGLQVEMGLVGALIVYPTGAGVPASGATTRWAYGHAGTAYERETLLVVGDIDPDIHAAVDDQAKAHRTGTTGCATSGGCTFTADLAHRFPKYWTLNGRTAPDVFARNYAGELPHQPYNTLPRLHPGERILLRMVGAGSDLHPMHHHGNNSWAIARDGRMLSNDVTKGPNLAMSDYTIRVVPGQTYDAIWGWTGAGLGWDVYGRRCGGTGQPTCASVYPITDARFLHQLPADRGKAFPVQLPSEFELAYGEFYSGSPYFGDFGIRPVGAGVANTSGAYFHMFHSHNEREVVNGGIFPGGMMTMMVIEPPGITID